MKGPIARGTIRTSFVLGLRLVVQAGTLLIVARMLGPDQFGAFAGVAALALILGTLSSFGTNLVLLGEMSKDLKRGGKVLVYALPTTLLCGFALLAIFILLSQALFANIDVPVVVVLFLGVSEILLQPIFSLMSAEHHAFGRIARAQLLQVLPLILRMLAAALVMLTQASDPLTAYALGYGSASVVALGFGSILRPARWPSWRCWRLPQRPELGIAMGYAAINISKAGPSELDKTLAVKLLPIEIAGVYAVSARAVGALTLPVTAMTLSALPRLFRGHTSYEGEHSRLLWWMFSAALGYSIVFAAILWCVAPAVDWIFGEEYLGIVEMVRWLCLAVPGMAIRLVAGNALMTMGRTWMRVIFEIIGLLTIIITAMLLVPKLGAKGMPFALAAAEWAMATIGAFSVFAMSRSQRKHVRL